MHLLHLLLLHQSLLLLLEESGLLGLGHGLLSGTHHLLVDSLHCRLMLCHLLHVRVLPLHIGGRRVSHPGVSGVVARLIGCIAELLLGSVPLHHLLLLLS